MIASTRTARFVRCAAVAIAGIVAVVAPHGRLGAAPEPAASGDLAPPDYRADLNAGVWVRGPNLPSPRQDAAAVTLADRVYVIGGFGQHNQQMNTTLVWEPQVVPEPTADPAEQRAGSRYGAWTYAAPIPEAVDHAAAAVLANYIYVAGGRIENLVTNKVWRYDTAADAWVELPSMPVPRYGAAMQAVGSKLYVIGGAVSHANDATSIEVFDTTTDRWSLIDRALPSGRMAFGSVVLDDKIIMVGGRDEQERNLIGCDIYDPSRNRWGVCSPLHQPRSDFGLSVVAGRLIAAGGEDLRFDATTQTTEISESFLRGWLNGPWLPGPRHGMAPVTVGNVMWLIGGASWSGTAPSSVVLRYVSPVVKVKFKGRSQ